MVSTDNALWMEALRYVGVALPLVVVLLWLLRESTAERRALTTAFLAALQTTVAQNTSALHDLSVTLAAESKMRLAEHQELVNSLREISRQREERPTIVRAPGGTS